VGSAGEHLSLARHALDLSFAVTMHKAQGITTDRVLLSLEKMDGERATLSGDALYVALTRTRSLKHVAILGETPIDIGTRIGALRHSVHAGRFVGLFRAASSATAAGGAGPRVRTWVGIDARGRQPEKGIHVVPGIGMDAAAGDSVVRAEAGAQGAGLRVNGAHAAVLGRKRQRQSGGRGSAGGSAGDTPAGPSAQGRRRTQGPPGAGRGRGRVQKRTRQPPARPVGQPAAEPRQPPAPPVALAPSGGRGRPLRNRALPARFQNVADWILWKKNQQKKKKKKEQGRVKFFFFRKRVYKGQAGMKRYQTAAGSFYTFNFFVSFGQRAKRQFNFF
jgi:hypothetical protein